MHENDPQRLFAQRISDAGFRVLAVVHRLIGDTGGRP